MSEYLQRILIDHVLPVTALLAIIGLPGGIGGFISAVWDHLEARHTSANGMRDCGVFPRVSYTQFLCFFLGRSLIGVAGAFGIVLAGVWIGRITFTFDSDRVVGLMALCMMAGLFSRRLLPIIGLRLEHELEKRLAEAEKNSKEAIETSRSSVSFAEAIACANTALSRDSSAEQRNAIEKLLSIREGFKRDRTLHIYLGRLYRKLGKYDEAIRVLRDFVNNVNQHKKDRETSARKVDVADAYYNIACYHALKSKELSDCHGSQSEIERLKRETMDSLRLAVEGNPENRDIAERDPDFDFLRDEINAVISGEVGSSGENPESIS